MKPLSHPEIFYEVAVEDGYRKTISKLFRSQNTLGSRAKALCYFLELELDDYDSQTEQPFIRVYVHHTQSGKRIEILSSGTYRLGRSDYEALQEEFHVYRTEKIQAPVAVVHKANHPHLLSIHLRHDNLGALNQSDTVVFLADNYWMFTKQKQITYMIA